MLRPFTKKNSSFIVFEEKNRVPKKKMKKGIFLLFLIVLFQFNLSKSSSLKVKGCTSEDCLINNDFDSEEFSFSSHVARMLYEGSQSQTGKTANNNAASVKCPTNQGYRSCLPTATGGTPNYRCATYTRGCK